MLMIFLFVFFFFSSRRRHTRFDCDWSSDVCSSDLDEGRLRDTPGNPRQIIDDAALIRTAPGHLAPEAVVEPDAGDGSRRKSPAELRWLAHERKANASSPGAIRSEERRVGKECRSRW